MRFPFFLCVFLIVLLVATPFFTVMKVGVAAPSYLVDLSKLDMVFRVPTFTFPYGSVTTQDTPELFQFNMTLNRRPAPFVSSFSINIESANLTFYYQPPLNEELNLSEYTFVNATHAMNGTDVLVYRPLNVVGSYAVYGNKQGNEYGTGKLCHIYRPLLIDAEGNQFWGYVNFMNDILTFGCDEIWLRNAVYPVVIDPSFGYTTAGGSNTDCSAAKVAMQFSAPEDGEITDVTFYAYIDDTHTASAAVYSDSADTPNARLSYVTRTDLTWQTVTWHSFTGFSQAVTGGTKYFLAEGFYAYAQYYYDSGSTPSREQSDYADDTEPPDDPFGSGTDRTDRIISIYANYTATGIPGYDYVDNDSSDVDSSPDVGTHSNFTTQHYYDSINDTLTEGVTGTPTTDNIFVDGFENGNYDLWTDGGVTSWSDGSGTPADNSTYGSPWLTHSGTYMADADNNDDGDLTTDNVDCSDATAIGIEFYFMNDDLDGADYQVYYYDGASYNLITNIGGIDPEDTWLYYSDIIATNSSGYFISTFRLRLHAACGSGEVAFLDDVTINKTYIPNPVYRLDLEEQFTSVSTDTYTNQELCIATGAFSGSEDLTVNVWNDSTWHYLMNLTANTWNNVSIAGYVASTVTIQFVDGLQTGDLVQNTWMKDACLLHFWNSTGGNEETVSATIPFSFGFNSLNSWSFETLGNIPFSLAFNGLVGLGKFLASLFSFTPALNSGNTYGVLKPVTETLTFAVNGQKDVGWMLQNLAIPFTLSIGGFFTSAILNFLNVFSSIGFTLAMNFLGAFGFDGGFSALLTLSSASGNTASFNLMGLFSFAIGFSGAFSSSFFTLLNVFSGISIGFNFGSLNAWAFNAFGTLPLTLGFSGSFAYSIGQTLLTITGAIPIQFLTNLLNSFTFNIFGNIPLTAIFNGSIHSLIQNFLNIMGSLNLSFTINALHAISMLLQQAIPFTLGFGSIFASSSFLTFLTIASSMFLQLAFSGVFPFGEWLTTQFNLWLIIGAVIGSLLVGILVFSIMWMRRREED